jgi:hypothetical protein
LSAFHEKRAQYTTLTEEGENAEQKNRNEQIINGGKKFAAWLKFAAHKLSARKL